MYKNLIFDYATKYSYMHDSIPAPDKFNITDNDYNDFVNFIKTKDFDYKTFTDNPDTATPPALAAFPGPNSILFSK